MTQHPTTMIQYRSGVIGLVCSLGLRLMAFMNRNNRLTNHHPTGYTPSIEEMFTHPSLCPTHSLSNRFSFLLRKYQLPRHLQYE